MTQKARTKTGREARARKLEVDVADVLGEYRDRAVPYEESAKVALCYANRIITRVVRFVERELAVKS